MNSDSTSLDRLHDLVIPPPVPGWPPAPGWQVVLAIVFVLFVIFVLRSTRRWRANAYRRAALTELYTVADAEPGAAARIAEILKRTALAAFPRAEVAGLSGDRWLVWLERTGAFAAPVTVRRMLSEDLYRGGRINDASVLHAYAVRWIKKHHAKSDTRNNLSR